MIIHLKCQLCQLADDGDRHQHDLFLTILSQFFRKIGQLQRAPHAFITDRALCRSSALAPFYVYVTDRPTKRECEWLSHRNVNPVSRSVSILMHHLSTVSQNYPAFGYFRNNNHIRCGWCAIYVRCSAHIVTYSSARVLVNSGRNLSTAQFAVDRETRSWIESNVICQDSIAIL